MPVHKVGKTGCQWGHHGKIYHGAGACKKAARQGAAAHAHGYRGHGVRKSHGGGRRVARGRK